MLEYRTNRFTHATEIFVSADLSALIEPLLDNRSASNFSYTVEIGASDSCAWCGALVVDCRLASGRWYNATVLVDPQGEPRADLTQPHICPECDRWEQLLQARTELNPHGARQ